MRSPYILVAARERLSINAQRAVRKAIERGEIAAPDAHRCVDCGSVAYCYDHRDYRRPLAVAPVCKACNVARGPARPVVDRDSSRRFYSADEIREDVEYLSGLRTPKVRENPQKKAEFRRLAEQGWTLEQIGVHFGITRERVRQLLEKYDLRGVRSAKRNEQSQERVLAEFTKGDARFAVIVAELRSAGHVVSFSGTPSIRKMFVDGHRVRIHHCGRPRCTSKDSVQEYWRVRVGTGWRLIIAHDQFLLASVVSKSARFLYFRPRADCPAGTFFRPRSKCFDVIFAHDFTSRLSLADMKEAPRRPQRSYRRASKLVTGLRSRDHTVCAIVGSDLAEQLRDFAAREGRSVSAALRDILNSTLQKEVAA